MRLLIAVVLLLTSASLAAAQNADSYRGGWRTDSGEAHTYEFSIRGATVRGVYCTYCADATTLAFVDGTFGPDGIRFEVTHVNANGSTAYTDKAIAKFSQGRLTVTGTSGAPGGRAFERVLIKDPRGPDPIPAMVSVLPKGPPVPANIQRRNPDGDHGTLVRAHGLSPPRAVIVHDRTRRSVIAMRMPKSSAWSLPGVAG